MAVTNSPGSQIRQCSGSGMHMATRQVLGPRQNVIGYWEIWKLGDNMKLSMSVVICIIIAAFSCMAQQNNQPIPLAPGRYVIDTSSMEVIPSMKELIRRSKLIIDGTVEKVLPSERLNQDQPGSLNTHSIITVNQVIRGELPNDQKSVTVIEPGGNLEGYEIINKRHPLVKSGERYFFFLKPNNRPGFVNDLQKPIYIVVGDVGKASVSEKGTIKFPPLAASDLRSFNDSDVAKFVTSLTELINYLYPKLPTNAVPTPITPGMRLPPVGLP
jgi:hypothetical protein